MKKRCIVLACSMVLSFVRLPLEAAEAMFNYNLDDCVEIGIHNNLQLRSTQYDAVIAAEGIHRAKAIYDTTLRLSARHDDSELPSSRVLVGAGSESTDVSAGITKKFSSGTTLGMRSGLNRFEFTDADSMMGGSEGVHSFVAELSVEQSLWKNAWGALDRANVRAATYGFESATYRYLADRESLARRIHVAYWEVYSLTRLYEVNLEALERARQLYDVNVSKFHDGLLEETDLLAAEASLATREVEVLNRRDSMLNAQDAMKELISLPRAQWEATRIAFDNVEDSVESGGEIDFMSAYQAALENRWDMAALFKERNRAREALLAAREEVDPDLSVLAGVGRGSQADNYSDSVGFDQTAWFVGLQLEVPWNRTGAKGAMRQAHMRLLQVDNDIERLAQVIDLDCRLAARTLSTSVQRLDATRRAAKLHARRLELETKKQKQGRATIQTVVDTQDDLAFAEAEHVEAVSSYHKALARYLAVQGNLLDRSEAEVQGIGDGDR